MRTDIIDHCQSEVLSRCKKPTNKFGMGCYYHIESVVQNAALLPANFLKNLITIPAKSRLSRTAFATTKEVYPLKSNLTKKSVWQTLTQFLTLTTFPVCYILPT